MMLLRWWMASLKHPATYIFWVLLILYHADGRGHGEIDCVAAPYAAWAFVRTGSFDVQHYEALKPYFHTSALRQSIDGRMVPVRSPGSTLAVVPFVAPFALIHERPLSSPSMHAIGRLAGATYVALLGAVFFIMCRRFAPSSAWPALILVTLGSCLYSVAAQAIWVHGPATFWLMISLELQTRKEFRRWLPFLAGLALGLAVLCRPTTAVFGVASGVAWLLMWDRRLLALIGGGLIPVGYLCWVNWCHYGSPLLGGYSAEATLEAPPFDVAFAGLLVAPSRGLFVYSPDCLLLPLGFAALARRNDLPQVLVCCCTWYDHPVCPLARRLVLRPALPLRVLAHHRIALRDRCGSHDPESALDRLALGCRVRGDSCPWRVRSLRIRSLADEARSPRPPGGSLWEIALRMARYPDRSPCPWFVA